MSENIREILRRNQEARMRLKFPANPVPDTGINLQRGRSAQSEPTPRVLKKLPPPPLDPRTLQLIQAFKALKFPRRDQKFHDILNTVAREFSITRRDIRARGRTPRIALPRQVACYFGKKLLKRFPAEMGRTLSLDHTTILYGISKVAKIVAEGGQLSEKILGIEVKLRENLDLSAVPAQYQPPMEIFEGAGSQVSGIFAVDNSGGFALPGSETSTPQDVVWPVLCPTTSIHS